MGSTWDATHVLFELAPLPQGERIGTAIRPRLNRCDVARLPQRRHGVGSREVLQYHFAQVREQRHQADRLELLLGCGRSVNPQAYA